MKNSQRPAGPGRNTTERRDAATAREELEELPGDTPGGAAPPSGGAQAQAATRHAERNAHARAPATDANSRSRRR
jgi:hypothetical protein